MEGIRDSRATCPGGSELHLCEPIGSTGSHRAAPPGRQILDLSRQPIWGIVKGHRKLITRVHEQVRRRIGGKGVEGRMERIRRRVWRWHTALCQEGELDVCD